MNKKVYENLEIEVIFFSASDVVTASGIIQCDNETPAV